MIVVKERSQIQMSVSYVTCVSVQNYTINRGVSKTFLRG